MGGEGTWLRPRRRAEPVRRQGFAKHGRSYEQIVGHYYKGTKVGRAKGAKVRVLVGGGNRVEFSGANRACGRRLKENMRYRFERAGGGVQLASAGGTRLAGCGDSGGARGGSGVTYAGRGGYRGELTPSPPPAG